MLHKVRISGRGLYIVAHATNIRWPGGLWPAVCQHTGTVAWTSRLMHELQQWQQHTRALQCSAPTNQQRAGV
jgi:hypothetical protein